ncbi:hypothetical protein FOZ63_019450 [Perkinsus olseni]|uniref:Uncharacterized protein n=1 Tax=Perkinsus olseni TaxID=32597 RepID=A0A7J6QU52_PEROL|nr:hypothetical protein FOZ63_019450 [Perkinsus olseni]KAF4741931.1 hypothetical protein FOZ62_013212 [Perkinsus olseni]
MDKEGRWIAGLLIQEAETRRRDESKREGRIAVNTEFLQRSISSVNHRDVTAAIADTKRVAAETAFTMKARELRERRTVRSPHASSKKRRFVPPSAASHDSDARRRDAPDAVVDLTEDVNWVKPGLVVRVKDKSSRHFRQKMFVDKCESAICTGRMVDSGRTASVEIKQLETVVGKSPGRNLEVVLPVVNSLPAGAVVSLQARHARQGQATVISKSIDGVHEFLVPLKCICEFSDNP